MPRSPTMCWRVHKSVNKFVARTTHTHIHIYTGKYLVEKLRKDLSCKHSFLAIFYNTAAIWTTTTTTVTIWVYLWWFRYRLFRQQLFIRKVLAVHRKDKGCLELFRALLLAGNSPPHKKREADFIITYLIIIMCPGNNPFLNYC